MCARWLAPLSWVVVASTAAAQAPPATATPSIDFRQIRPPLDPHAGMEIDSSEAEGHTEVNAAFWLHYEFEPIVLEDAAGNKLAAPVEHRVSGDYQAAFGLGEWVTLGVTAPVALYQTGDSTEPWIPGGGSLSATALGDIVLRTKLTALRRAGSRGLGVAFAGNLSLPTGDTRSYMANGAVAGDILVLADHAWRHVTLRGSGGYSIRSSHRELLGTVFGDALPWGLGLSVSPDPAFERRSELFLSLRGALSIEPAVGVRAASTAAAGVAARCRFGDASLLAGLELPLVDAAGAAGIRATASISWAPEAHDADQDGLLDEDDACPSQAEDVDETEDSDGCPDPDDDRDGIRDRLDLCRTEPEDFDGFSDDDGCPEEQLLEPSAEPAEP